MSRILSIDYGAKRTGVAVTDPLRISINPLPTISPLQLDIFLDSYLSLEDVGIILIGYPTHKDQTKTKLCTDIDTLRSKINKQFPNIEIIYRDESYTSVQAKELIFMSGVKKKKRRDKSLVDQMSAVIILKQYLETL